MTRSWLALLLCACGPSVSAPGQPDATVGELPDAAPPPPSDASVADVLCTRNCAAPICSADDGCGGTCEPATSGCTALVPVYHYIDRLSAFNFYTTNDQELATAGGGMQLQGVAFYVAGGPAAGTVPLYRFSRPCFGHLYSTDPSADGCSDCTSEGTLGWIGPNSVVAPEPLHALDGDCDYVYSIDEAERQAFIGFGFVDRGPIGFTWKCGPGEDCCVPSCAGRICGADDFCGGTCAAGSGCCEPACAGAPCGAPDGCGSSCWQGSGCVAGAFAGAWPDRDTKVAVLPNMVNQVPGAQELADMQAALGPGGPAAALGFSTQTQYCLEIESSLGWNYDTALLRAALQASQDADMPVLIHLNGGHWCKGGLHERATGINLESDLWRDDQVAWGWAPGANAPAPYRAATGDPAGGFASYSRLFDETSPGTYRYWKRRFLIQAAQTINAFYAQPGVKPLLVGVSLDSETEYSLSIALDYNPTFVEEWREFLQGGGIYGPGGPNRGQGRAPAMTLDQFNSFFGTSFADWSDVTPPPPPAADAVTFTPLWHEWTRFRVEAAHHLTEDMEGWIVEGGLPSELIYNHQASGLSFGGSVYDLYFRAGEDLATSPLGDGAGGGITYYGASERDAALFAQARAYGGRWGVFEYNPLDFGADGEQARDQAALVALREAGADILCPYAWPGDPGTGLNIAGTPFAAALVALLADPTPRPPIVDPAAPGTIVYRLIDHFGDASGSGPDTHVVASVLVGTTAEAAIYQKPAASLTFPGVALPAGRLVLRLDAGLANAAIFGGDGVHARVLVAGTPVLDFVIGPEDTWWHRWRPFLVDISAYAGQTVDLTLEVDPRGSSTGDDFLWGDPRVFSVP